MNSIPIKFLLFLILVWACSTSTDSTDPLDFEQMQIKYYKSGGWINFYQIDVSNDGTAKYTELSHANIDTLDYKSFNLTSNDKENLSLWFASFKGFKREYNPSHWYTDGNYHTIVFEYEGQKDTVAVYEPENCKLPSDLLKIIDFFEAKITYFRSVSSHLNSDN